MLGVAIAFRTAKTITEPLAELMPWRSRLPNAGELDHQIDINREDEIGELARTFKKMVVYLKEMAALSEAIAGGNLSVVVQPRSKHDTLGNAFLRMWKDCDRWCARYAMERRRSRADRTRWRRVG